MKQVNSLLFCLPHNPFLKPMSVSLMVLVKGYRSSLDPPLLKLTKCADVRIDNYTTVVVNFGLTAKLVLLVR